MNGISWLLDTNVVIGLLKGDSESLMLTKDVPLEKSAVSQITRMELLSFPDLETEEKQEITEITL